MLDYRVILFSYFPCMIFAAYTGMAWLGIRMKIKTTVLAGITAAILDFFVRKAFIPLGIPPGWDLPIMVIILTFVLKAYSRERVSLVFGGSLISYIFISAGDYLIGPNILKFLNLTVEDMWKNPWNVVIIGNTCSSILYLAGLIAGIGKFKIIDLSQARNYS